MGVGRDGRPGARLEVGDITRAVSRFRDDQMTDHAAALTYFTLLSLAPSVLAAVAVLGVFGQASLIGDFTSYLRGLGAPRELVDAVGSIVETALAKQDQALVSLVLGLAVALNGASGAFGAVGRALNVVFRVQEGRGFVRRKAADIAWTIVIIVLVLVTLILVFLGGGLVDDVFALLGLGDTAAAVWRIARWPGALSSAALIYAIVYFAAPNVEVRRFQWITPGAVLGVVLWIVASVGFFLYVANFSYGAAYGALAGVVVLLVWIWLTNSILLFGAELNAAIDLRRSPDLPKAYDGPSLPEKVPSVD